MSMVAATHQITSSSGGIVDPWLYDIEYATVGDIISGGGSSEVSDNSVVNDLDDGLLVWHPSAPQYKGPYSLTSQFGMNRETFDIKLDNERSVLDSLSPWDQEGNLELDINLSEPYTDRYYFENRFMWYPLFNGLPFISDNGLTSHEAFNNILGEEAPGSIVGITYSCLVVAVQGGITPPGGYEQTLYHYASTIDAEDETTVAFPMIKITRYLP